MNQQYLVQPIPQIIDLFENMPTQPSLNVAITAFKPFEYTFLSADQVNTMALTTLPLLTATNVGRTVSMSQRYLMVKAEQPIAITVHVAVNQKTRESFAMPTIGWLFIGTVVVVILLIMLAAFLFVYDPFHLMHKSTAVKDKTGTVSNAGTQPIKGELSPPSKFFGALRRKRDKSPSVVTPSAPLNTQ